MEISQLKECIKLVGESLKKLETAKADCKVEILAYLDTYEIPKDERANIKKIAAAVINGELDEYAVEVGKLVDLIEAVRPEVF